MIIIKKFICLLVRSNILLIEANGSQSNGLVFKNTHTHKYI